MKQLDHPNVVKLFEVIDTEDTLFLILEYAAGGEVSPAPTAPIHANTRNFPPHALWHSSLSRCRR